MQNKQFSYHSKVINIPIFFIAICWIIYFIEIKFNFNFNKYGIYPQEISGLKGVLFSPFIHGDAAHLLNNSIPLVVMLGCLFYFYKNIASKVLIFGIILTGLLTWSFARPSFHIGASGIIYFLLSFIFFSGIFRRYYRLIALSFVFVFLYGSMIWYVLPVENHISWEGHLSGFLVGFVFAVIFKNKGPQPTKFEYSKNEEFEKLFDEDGNFSPPIPDEEVEKDDKTSDNN